MTPIRPFLRQAAYQSGILTILRTSKRHALTVVMFHRVMDPSDADFAHSDPIYTVSTPMFEQLLDFFHDHYTVVDVQHVIDANDGIRALPEHALLITFDDGWADNLRYAAPLLQAHCMPAVIFVAAEAVQAGSPAWWQEEVFAASRSGRLTDWLSQDRNRAEIVGAAAEGAKDNSVDLVTRLALMDAGVRENFLTSLPRQPCHTRMMLSTSELGLLADFRIAVGLHGYRHVPLTSLTDVTAELVSARDTLAALTAGAAVTTALGCPHGRYDDKVVAAAHAVGIKLVFTSDKLLNATEQGMLTTVRPLGRIGLTTSELQFRSAPDRLDPARAARWLWDRECR